MGDPGVARQQQRRMPMMIPSPRDRPGIVTCLVHTLVTHFSSVILSSFSNLIRNESSPHLNVHLI